MNAALILSGGCGKRFGSNLPKQYHLARLRMVVEYVIEAAANARSIDTILIAATLPCERLNRLQPRYRFEMTASGDRRNDTLKNGLDWLNERGCDKVIILDAVRPMVTSAVIDRYMELLDEGYDAVTTAQPITDSLGSYDLHEVDRDRYYLMQSPEAFRFPLLYEYFDQNSPLTEVVQQLPKGTPCFLNFDFQNNIKLTYPWDLAYIELALWYRTAEAFSDFWHMPGLLAPKK